jgi:hypothetical protein
MLYAKHYDALQALASIPLNEEPVLDQLEISRKFKQSIYRDILKYKTGKGLVNFLGPIASGFIRVELGKRFGFHKQNYSWENFREILSMDNQWTTLFLRFFTKNPIRALSEFNFKNTEEEKIIVTKLSMMWYELHKACE